MKNMLLLLLLAFISGIAFGQTDVYKELILTVEKKPKNSQIFSGEILQFKPGKVLQIKTLDGKKLTSSKYFLHDSAVVMIMQSEIAPTIIDTISLNGITFIKGQVFGDSERKAIGAIIAIISLPVGIFPIIISAQVGGPIFFVGIPFIAASAVGLSITGARKFNTIDKWELKIVDR
ncbi:MAG: hypothetical protein Q7V19_10190 [Bacteroidales bacterium]|nr:hypothetical protein [Bacteroidales bacterium]